MIHFPAFNVPVDIGSYLDDMDFEANIGSLNKVVSFKAGDAVSAGETISYSVSEITDQLVDNGNFTHNDDQPF